MKLFLIAILMLSFSFGVCAQNTPNKVMSPGVYFGLAQSGEECSINSTLLSIRDTFNDELLEGFRILSFEMAVGKVSLKANGTIMDKPIAQLTTEMQSLLKAAKSGSTVSFIIKAQGSDSLARLVAATFTIK